MKNLVTLVLCLFMVLALNTVYGGSQKDLGTKTNSGSGTAQNVPVSKPGSVKYPVTNSSVKLKYWLPMSNRVIQYVSNYSELPVFQELQKRTGVSIQFINPSFGQEKEQFNIMIASGDLPDIIQNADFYAGGLAKGYEDGVYIDLLQYIKKDAPDYYELINNSTVAQKQTYIENKVLAFYLIKEGNPPYHRPILRADWLKEFGITNTPRTYNEWEAYFKAVLARKPGVAPMFINFGAANDMDLWMGAYDMLYDWYVIDGKVTHFYDNQKYRDFLIKMNQWYENGYITKDFVSLTTEQQVTTLYDTGKLAAYNGSVDNVRLRALPINMIQNVESAPNPRLTVSQKLHSNIAMWPVDPALTVATAITTQCKDIENAVKLLNYGYTEEGHILYDYGIEGKTYSIVNGEYKFTDFVLNNPDGLPVVTVNNMWKYHIAPKHADPDIKTIPNIANDKEGVDWRLRWFDDPNVDDAYRMLPVILTPNELEEVTAIMVDVSAYADEMKLKFIIGAEPISNFGSYTQRLNSLKFQRAKQIYQAAYDRLMK
jgi:putative aldouronate transport system substrate-binding protein